MEFPSLQERCGFTIVLLSPPPNRGSVMGTPWRCDRQFYAYRTAATLPAPEDTKTIDTFSEEQP